MNGLLVIDKPPGMTSHDVVARVRRALKTKRVGHTGTLDPFATGVLVILVGKATRLARFLDKDAKEYIATVRLGYETDTGDITGKQASEPARRKTVSIGEIREVLEGFRGECKQVPPMFSAKKVRGKKLYELARQGIEHHREPVSIRIFDIGLISRTDNGNQVSEFELCVRCSAGTYIRTLAEDICRKLGAAGHLTALRRTRAGKFDLRMAIALDDLENSNDGAAFLLPMENAVSHLPEFVIENGRIEPTKHGLPTRVHDIDLRDGEAVRMIDCNGAVLAVGVYKASEGSIKPTVVLS